MPRRGTIRNMSRVRSELAKARRERNKSKRETPLTPGEEGILAAKANAGKLEQDAAPATPSHLDYAEEAEAAERAGAWPQAAALWLRASETCSDVDRALEYARNADACNRRRTVDQKLESIAKNVLKIPTLSRRGSDSLDFHDLSVGQLKLALRAAYEAGRSAVREK